VIFIPKHLPLELKKKKTGKRKTLRAFGSLMVFLLTLQSINMGDSLLPRVILSHGGVAGGISFEPALDVLTLTGIEFGH